jgi:putative spermidine/putrescine transport system substrate-binding protein
MRRSFFVTGTLVFGMTAALVATPAESRDLTIVAYGGATQDAMREAFFEPFMAETGIAIVEDTDPNLAKVRAMVTTGNVVWDILDQEAPDAALGCTEGVFEQIDYSKLDVDNYFEGTVGECGLGIYTAGNVLAYNNKFVDEPPKTWADFWNLEKWPGKRGFWYTPKGALEFALMADDVAPADVYSVLGTPEGIDRAFAKLDEIKSEIVWWRTGGELINRLAAGEYAMTMAWNGRIDVANRTDNQDFGIAWEAGFTYVHDQWVVVAGTPNLEQAYEYLNFVTDPERQAVFMEHIAYSAANLDSYEHLDDNRLRDLPLSPVNVQHGVVVDETFWATHLDSLTERFTGWAAE